MHLQKGLVYLYTKKFLPLLLHFWNYNLWINGFLVGAQACPQTPKAVAQTCSVKKVFLEISQNSQENTCARASFLINLQEQNSQENTCARVSFLIKFQAPATLLKKRLWHRCFPVNFAKFLGTPFFTEHPWYLPLKHGPLGLNGTRY